jgi:hypothetical protein
MIYLNVEDLGWRPYITSWLATKAAAEPVLADLVSKHIDKYLEAALEHKRLHVSCLVYMFVPPRNGGPHTYWDVRVLQGDAARRLLNCLREHKNSCIYINTIS